MLLALAPCLSHAEEPVAPMVVVQSFVRAYNGHDLDELVKLLDEEVSWLAVKDDSVVAEARNRAELLNRLAVYFKEHPNARSVLEQSFVSGPFVSVRERAFWKQEGKTLSAISLAVYETKGGRIVRAWYYPAEPQP
jgi:hypothetical protein